MAGEEGEGSNFSNLNAINSSANFLFLVWAFLQRKAATPIAKPILTTMTTITKGLIPFEFKVSEDWSSMGAAAEGSELVLTVVVPEEVASVEVIFLAKVGGSARYQFSVPSKLVLNQWGIPFTK